MHVNSVLLVKTGRDLRRRLPQFAAVAVTVLLGVTLFTASYDAYRNLSASYDRTYERLHFADLTARSDDATRLAEAVGGLDGVAAVTCRTEADLPVEIGDGRLRGRVIGLPADGRQAAVNRVDVVRGSRPAPGDPEGVLVERHAAKTFALVPGDRVRVFDGSGWRTLTVRGVAVSPEYLWPAPSRQELIVDPRSFAVFFVPEPTARSLAGLDAPDQALVELTGPARGSGAAAHVTRALRDAGAVDVVTRADQPSNAALAEDLRGFSELAVAFPVLFLSAAAVAAYILLTRLVLAERAVIGTLLAAGARRGAVVRHYLGHAVLTGTAGAVAGTVLGAFATSAVTRAYTSAVDVPDTVIGRHPGTVVTGLAFGVLVGVVAGGAPALSAARTPPAEAMRGPAAPPFRPRRWGRLLTRLRRIPLTWRMALRDLSRSPRRTFATMTGGVLALILVLTAVGMMTSMRAALAEHFDRVQRQDATVLAEAGNPDLARRLSTMRGVSAVEPVTTVRVTASDGGRSYTTNLTGFQPDTVMHGFRTPAGDWRDLPDDGVLAGRALADRLHVRPGDQITVTAPGQPGRKVVVAGLVEEPMGTALYAVRSTVRATAGRGHSGYLLRFADGTARDGVRDAVLRLPGVLSYTDEQALRDEVDRYLGLFWVFIGSMLVLGGTLAFTVIYVTMTVNLAERTTELATLRAAGASPRRVAGTLAAENLTAVALALPAGLALGTTAAWAFLRSFDSDLFTLRLSLGWPALTLSVAAVLSAAALSQLPAARALRRLDVARVVRERAR
ncbi:FtsX-like permease family protein [Streptomyces sp. WMMC1477]|uniref:FtsX-like permease family protein n=1 Tax=Streptomyces sp. WMMC1477 TaxID=3015155 RepID=UPI0022B5EAD5|nr:FtsX-like permease family protein [Streptomyces sp. WMMC1477]MCZ7432205.1 FtsX-like permease family protein [Streptomyces sp. WMMC1477]